MWRFFCSVRAAIAEIAFLALLVLIGTLRGSAVPFWLADGLPFLQPLVDRWYDWDVFRSPIFAATLALLAIAIAVCTINRVPGIWQTISHPRVRTSLGYLVGPIRLLGTASHPGSHPADDRLGRDPHARNAAGAASATRNARW